MGPRPHLWFFVFETATLAPELQVSMGPCPHLWFCAFTTATLWPELIVSMGPRPHLSFCACKTTGLASELLVSMGLSPHLWFLHANQRLLDQISKSLWVPVFACWFVNENRVLRSRMTLVYCSEPSSVVLCIQNSDFSIRITSLYGSQISPVDLWMQNRVNRSRMTLVYWSQPQSVVLSTQNSDFSVRINSLYGTQPSFVDFACKTTRLASELLVSMGPRPHLTFCAS